MYDRNTKVKLPKETSGKGVGGECGKGEVWRGQAQLRHLGKD